MIFIDSENAAAIIETDFKVQGKPIRLRPDMTKAPPRIAGP